MANPNLHADLWGPETSDVIRRLRAENTALAAALADIATGDCADMGGQCADNDRCDVCTARHALGVAR